MHIAQKYASLIATSLLRLLCGDINVQRLTHDGCLDIPLLIGLSV